MKDLSKIYLSDREYGGIASVYRRMAFGTTESIFRRTSTDNGVKVDFPYILVRLWRPTVKNEEDGIEVVGEIRLADINPIDREGVEIPKIRLRRKDNVLVFTDLFDGFYRKYRYEGQMPTRCLNRFLSVKGDGRKGGVDDFHGCLTDYVGVFNSMREVKRALRDVYSDL